MAGQRFELRTPRRQRGQEQAFAGEAGLQGRLSRKGIIRAVGQENESELTVILVCRQHTVFSTYGNRDKCTPLQILGSAAPLSQMQIPESEELRRYRPAYGRNRSGSFRCREAN